MSHLRKQMLNAVREHAQAHIDKHRMNVEIYLTNPVGVGNIQKLWTKLKSS